VLVLKGANMIRRRTLWGAYVSLVFGVVSWTAKSIAALLFTLAFVILVVYVLAILGVFR